MNTDVIMSERTPVLDSTAWCLLRGSERGP